MLQKCILAITNHANGTLLIILRIKFALNYLYVHFTHVIHSKISLRAHQYLWWQLKMEHVHVVLMLFLLIPVLQACFPGHDNLSVAWVQQKGYTWIVLSLAVESHMIYNQKPKKVSKVSDITRNKCMVDRNIVYTTRWKCHFLWLLKKLP